VRPRKQGCDGGHRARVSTGGEQGRGSAGGGGQDAGRKRTCNHVISSILVFVCDVLCVVISIMTSCNNFNYD
jgi:hypothetical protein